MNAAIYDKLVSKVTMKVTYTGADIKLDIKDIEATVAVPVGCVTKNRITKKLPKTKGESERITDDDLPLLPAGTSIVFLAFKLAPNQKIANPLLFASQKFDPKVCNDPKILIVSGDAMATFWVAKYKDSAFDLSEVARDHAIPPEAKEIIDGKEVTIRAGRVFFYNPNDQEVVLDVYLGYSPRDK